MQYDSHRPILYAYSNTPIEPEFKTLSDMVGRFHLPLEPRQGSGAIRPPRIYLFSNTGYIFKYGVVA